MIMIINYKYKYYVSCKLCLVSLDISLYYMCVKVFLNFSLLCVIFLLQMDQVRDN